MGKWISIETGRAIDFIGNGTSETQVSYITEFPVTRIETISDGNIDYSKVGFVEWCTERYRLNEGDILLSNINSLKHIGKVAFFQNERILYHGMNLLRLKFKNEYDKLFLFYYFCFHKKWFEKMAAQAINQASINQSTIKEFILKIPESKAEQTRIAQILSTADKAIAQTEALIAKYQRIKTGLMQDLLTRGIDEHGNIRSEKTHRFKTEKGLRVPEEWDNTDFGSLFHEFRTGSTPRRNVPAFWENGSVNWVTSGELKYEPILSTLEKITKEAVIKTNLILYSPGTFFIAITGLEAEGTRGSCAIIACEATTNQSCMSFQSNEKIDVRYLYQYYLHFGKFISLRYAQGSKQQSLNARIVSKIPICIPHLLSEQKRIAEKLERFDILISNQKMKLHKLQSLKTGLMQDLLSGKVRVKMSEALIESDYTSRRIKM